MILAAPLVIPFAKAVGISIATLGMAKAVDMVNDYIQENPEESAMILKTLVPNLGIGEIFMKKEDKISLEDLDEMTDEEAQDLTKEEKAELMKQAGKSGGKNKRQIMIDLSEKLGLSGEGKEKQDIEYEVDERYDEGGVEEVSKPKFDYTKFFRKRRADGGAIGIEVLFEEKKKNGGRVGLFMGGSPLEGQALSIYNSMNAYGFSDQEIANALQEQGLYTPGSTTPPPATIQPIGFQGGSGGGGITELQKTYTRETAPPQKFIGDPTAQLTGKGRLDPMGSGFDEILKSVTASNTNRVLTDDQLKQKAFFQDVYQEPQELSFFDKAKSGLQSFKDKFFAPKIKGELGTRLQKQYEFGQKLPSFFSAIAGMRSPFNPNSPTYNPNLPGQLNFLEGSPMVTRTTGQFIDPKLGAVEGNFMTTTGALIGRDPNTGALKYGPGSVLAGKNVISGFGTNDYEQALMDYITKMSANKRISAAGKAAKLANAKAELAALTNQNVDDINIDDINTQIKIAKANKISAGEAAGVMAAIADQNKESAPGRGDRGNPGGSSGAMTDDNVGTYCFDPNTLVQMADGSEKKIKEIQLGDQTKGGEVTGVFQFKASDEIHNYKGVVVAGSHYVKEDGKFIMVQDSPMSIKIDKIPVVYSLDTTGRRIFINDIEFADYNGDGVAKNFLTNAGVNLTGFDTEVLRQVENRLI